MNLRWMAATAVSLALASPGAAHKPEKDNAPVAVIGVPSSASSVDVETIAPKRIVDQFVYSAKFLCGTVQMKLQPQLNVALPLPEELLVPGTYLAAVNVHNPHPVPVQFSKKATETRPQGEPRATPGRPETETLGPNEGVKVHCGNIRRLLGREASLEKDFLEGFVVISAPQEMDVTAVYTFGHSVGWPVMPFPVIQTGTTASPRP